MVTQVITLALMMCEAPFLGGLEGIVRVRIPARSGENAIFGSVSVDSIYADVAELADALDLGSSGLPVQVQVLSSAPDNDNPNPVPIGDGFGFLVYL